MSKKRVLATVCLLWGMSIAANAAEKIVYMNDWLPGGDELTPTMKLKRKPIATKYASEIEAKYAGRV